MNTTNRNRALASLNLIMDAARRGEPGAAKEIARLSRMITLVASLTVCWDLEEDPESKKTLEGEMHRVLDS